MSLPILFALLAAIAVYWFMTQILPERRKASILRPTLADGLLANVNDCRHQRGLPLLELDDELILVAENKAAHQVMTGCSEEGWDYPPYYASLLGRSLLLEALFTGPMSSLVERMARQHDIFEEAWGSCGIGVASCGPGGKVVVVLILCREAWETAAEPAGGSVAEWSQA